MADTDTDEQITKTRKTRALTDEKRAELAARMRAINDKRILDAAKKIETQAAKPEPKADLSKVETPEIAKTEPKKKRVIQIVQLDSDDESVEIQVPKMKKEPAEPKVEPPPKARKPRVSKPKEDDEPITKPKAKQQTPASAPIPQPPMLRCKFL